MAFKLFDFTKEGKGIKKEESSVEKPGGFLNFFVVFGRKFWNLSGVNFLYVLTNFPLLFALFAFTGTLDKKLSAPTSVFYSQIYGVSVHTANPAVSAFLGACGGQTVMSFPSVATYIFYAVSFLFILTFGLANTGLAYVLREYSSGYPVYVLTDFFDCIKRNFRQALCLGIVDIIACFSVYYMLTFWSTQTGFINDVFFYFSIFVALVYFFMRMYMYVIMITFKLSIFKILKNSFIFALVGLKRNIVALIGIAVVLLLNVYLFFYLPMFGYIMPFIITISAISFMGIYAAYPNIKKHMVDPYYDANNRDKTTVDAEPIFKDRG